MADIGYVLVSLISNMISTTRYVSHEQRVAEYSYTSDECSWLTHHPTPSVNGPGIVIDCRYHDDHDDDHDDDGDEKDKDLMIESIAIGDTIH